jgi:hypothetical protein
MGADPAFAAAHGGSGASVAAARLSYVRLRTIEYWEVAKVSMIVRYFAMQHKRCWHARQPSRSAAMRLRATSGRRLV